MTRPGDERVLEKERRIMAMMRQVLSAVARDTAPPSGKKHPLSENTIMGVRDCLALISARERELNSELGDSEEKRPHYVDEPETTKEVSLDSIKKK